MNQKFLLAWAVAATALALVSLGFALGRAGSNPAVDPPMLNADPTMSTMAGPDAESHPADTYSVPDALAELPGEWRTQFDDEYGGYAILFDPGRRELIVEQCAHPGYIDRTGAPVELGWEFCESVLWGTLATLDSDGALVRDRRRGSVEVELSLSGGDPPKLSLAFADHDMVLIPGSKNDLFQAIDRSPEMMAQRERKLQMAIAEEEARRRMAEEAQNTGKPAGEPVPVFIMPSGDDDRDEER
ncbi:MAG: hypothetical protein HKN49_06905 [Gammaproteobacteria bacterium]|nr:hypothetical protein [Gammaproteobacteria bacterium]